MSRTSLSISEYSLTSVSFASNNFLSYGPAWSGVAERVLSLACQMPYPEAEWKKLYPELDMGSEFIFRVALSRRILEFR